MKESHFSKLFGSCRRHRTLLPDLSQLGGIPLETHQRILQEQSDARYGNSGLRSTTRSETEIFTGRCGTNLNSFDGPLDSS